MKALNEKTQRLVGPLPVSRWQGAGWGWKKAGRPALFPPRRGARCRAALSRHWAESRCTADTNTRHSRAGWTGSRTARLKWLNRSLESIQASVWPHLSCLELYECLLFVEFTWIWRFKVAGVGTGTQHGNEKHAPVRSSHLACTQWLQVPHCIIWLS